MNEHEPKTCLVCGSSDVVDEECRACAEVREDEAASEAPHETDE